MQKPTSIIFFVVAFVFSNSITASPLLDYLRDESPRSIFERLSEEDVLEISVRTDVDKLLENKKSSKYQIAFIKFADSGNTEPEWTVDIRARGKYRNRVCDFPPIKIKFGHSVLGPENLKAYKSLKLVTHCGDQAEAEELAQREFLAYKIYNKITDQSLRVQLVRINWVDSKGNHEIGEKWGFIIENKDELAERLGGEVYEELGVENNYLNAHSEAKNSLFQYMIGNADWDLLVDKNIYMVKSNSSRDLWVVPYDFDFSGLVNASYAVSEYGQTSIKERIYLGSSTANEIEKAKEVFLSKKEEIIDLIKSFEHLSRSGRNEIKKYINSFYSSLDEPFRDKAFYQERLASNKVGKANREG